MNNTCIKVSVIMPVYNPGQYLCKCIDSLLGQTLKDVQIIIVDDASTDGSWQILKEYANKDERLVLLKNPYNLGAAKTRNIGMQMAKGEYLSVVDADDYFEVDYLETMYNACKTHNLDVAVCGIWTEDEVKKSKADSFIDICFIEKITRVFNYKDISSYIFQLFIIAPFSKMVKRDFIEKYCLEFQDIKYCNDVFWGEMSLLYAERMLYIDRHMVHYRHNTGQQLSTQRGDSQYPVYAVLKKMRFVIELIGKFEEVKKSYYTLACELIMYNLSFANSRALIEGINYWKAIGLNDVGLSNLTNTDFISDVYYNRIEAIKRGNVKKIEIDDDNKRSMYKKFFDYLKSDNLCIGIWGFGKNGVEFYREAVRQRLDIIEIYDKDEEKWDELGVPSVKPYEHRNIDVNMVVVTNSRYWQDIVQAVKSRDASVKVVDFDLFLRYGIFRIV